MPRNKAMKGSSLGLKKITIKPFSKPPTLPPKFYEDTSAELLNGTLDILKKGQSASSSDSAPASVQLSSGLSLQNSYTSVVNLVSHQYGPRLYKDLRKAMQEGAKEVLPTHGGSAAASSSNARGAVAVNINAEDWNVLSYVDTQYQLYVDYLLLCKHVFLPLDRTHLWQEEGELVVKRTMATSHTHSTLWEVGLCQFRDRLHELGLDEKVYRHWFQMLVDDWSGQFALRSLLQATWHMWQDLHLLPTIMSQLQPDLEVFLQRQSEKAKETHTTSTDGTITDRPYAASSFVSYVYDKWMHMSQQWTFLPKIWLCTLLEEHLLQPHLHPDWLLAPQHFHPLLEQELLQPLGGTPSPISAAGASPARSIAQSSEQTAMVKLWLLAGRLPNGYKQVSACVAQYARTKGMALVQPALVVKKPSTANNNAMISDLIDLQQKLVRLVSKLPQGADHFNLKLVWEEVVNVPTSPSVAESLAKFVDQILKSNKKMDQYALQQTPHPQHTIPAGSNVEATTSPPSGGANNDLFSRIISGIFVHLQAKDIFEAFYKRDLAKRLLWNRVVSMDVEKHFVSLLKAECGAGYTSKMEGMFQDVDWSREAMSRYKQMTPLSSSTSEANVEMEAQVLTTGYWPVYPQYPHLILPEALKIPQERFTTHYKTKYQGRRMTWQYALGHCVVRANGLGKHKSKVYELVMSLCQALVLIQFQDQDDQLTLPQLSQKIGLDDHDEMERILQSLSLGKDGTRVLRKLDHDAEQGKKKKIRLSVDDKDKFCINMGFDSNQRRIRITNIMWKETKEEREKTVEAVSRDRLYMIDASLVRIMKARKTILHQQLIPQVLEQVKVPAQPADVKKRIESLIEREYMERDPKDRSRYNYLA